MTRYISSSFSFFKNLLSNAFRGYPDAGNNDPVIDLEVSSSGKRQHDENSSEVVCLKKRKLDLANSPDLGGLFLSSNDEKMSLNQRPSRKNTRANSRKVLSNDSSSTFKVKTAKTSIYSCSDSIDGGNSNELGNCKVVLQDTESSLGNKGGRLGRTNFISARQGSSLSVSPVSSHVCHRSPSCLDRIHQEKEKATLCEMFKVSAHKRNPLPLTTSALHNTKQNNQVIPNTITNKRYFLRQPTPLFGGSPNIAKKMSPIKETASHRTVIDLTGEEDDSNQKKIIETNVRNSAKMKDFKCSFVWNTPKTSPNYITDMLKKYDLRRRNQETHIQKISRDMQKDKEDFHKTLVECLEERLVLKEHVTDEKRTRDLVPMNEAMMEEIRRILSSGKTTLVQIKDTGIKAQDIYTLHDCRWLNDEVINAYMNLIKNRSEGDAKLYPKVHCFNTFFYPQLLNRGYSSVRRWTKKIDIFDHTIIIVPIHLGNHWCLVEIRTKEKTIKYYDSLGSPNNRCLETMLHYLTNEYEDKKGRKLNALDWQVINVPRDEIPNQKNANDCGVFACTYAEHITRNANFCFDQEDMSYFREKMTYEILTGKLLL